MSEALNSPEAKSRRFRPYSKYKDSGIEWLGDIPANWEIVPLKHLCSRSAVYGANEPAEAYRDQGVRFLRTTDISDSGDLVGGGVYVSLDAVAEYLLQTGDLLFSRSGTIGRSFLYDSVRHGPCAYAGYLVRFVPGPRLLPLYGFFLTKSQQFEQWAEIMTISSTIGNLNAQKYANMPCPVPPFPEQSKIALFLGRETAKIDALIEKNERLIELLQEKRTALITQAVTKGLDPTVPIKDSGVEWLGEIPAHWEVSSLKRRAKRIQTGTTPPTGETRYYENGVIPWYGPGSFAEDLPLQKPVKFISESALHDGVARVFEADSALIVTIGATIGKVAYMEHPGSCNQQITCVTFDIRQVFPRYGAYQLKRLEPVLRGRAPNTTLPIIDQEEVGSLSFAAPLFSEQEAIVVFLDRETAWIDALVAKIQEAIDRLKEYRTALISAAVTGKIDVQSEYENYSEQTLF